MDNGNVPLLDPNIEVFDITLLVALVKQIPVGKNCFKKSNNRCNPTCVDCNVREAVENVRKLRNTVIHGTHRQMYEDLKNGIKGIPEFGSFKTWERLKNQIEGSIFKRLRDYIMDDANFPVTKVDKVMLKTRDEDIQKLELEKDIIKHFPAEERSVNFDKKIIQMLLKESENKEHAKEWREKLSVSMNRLTVAHKEMKDSFLEFLFALKEEIGKQTNDMGTAKVDPTPIDRGEALDKITLKTWKNKCLHFFRQFFKAGVNVFDYVEPDEKLEKILNDWFNKEVKKGIPYNYALITNYTAKAHQSFEKGKSVERLTSKGCILLISFKTGRIFFVKSSIETTRKRMEEELDAIKSEIIIFKELFDLGNNKIKVHPILIVTNTPDHKIENQSIVKLNDVVDVIDWLEKIDKENKRLDRKCCDSMLSRIVGYLSILHEKELPHIDNGNEQLIQKIPLTREQNEIIENDELRHVILRGSYGTGKTLVLRKKLRKLVSESKDEITVYYILNDSAGMLYEETKQFLAQYKDELAKNGKEILIREGVDLVHSTYRRADVTLCLIPIGAIDYPQKDLDESLNLEESNTHVFIDEFNGETLTLDVATKLKILVESKMKDSILFIIPQPLQVERIMNEKTNEKKGFCFKETEMKDCFLQKNIRNPECIHKLFDVSKEVISEFPLEYRFRRETLDNRDEAIRPDSVFGIDEIDEKREKERPENEAENSLSKFISERSSSESNLQNAIEISFHKTSHLSNDENSEKLENNYKIAHKASCGHAIEGDLPSCYFPMRMEKNAPVQYISDVSKCHLFLALDEAQATNYGSVIVCSSIKESTLCVEALINELSKEKKEKLEIYLPALQQDKSRNSSDIYKNEKEKDRIVVTDFIGVRGMELSNVTVFLSTDIYFTAPFLLEVMTRSYDQLSFIYLNIGYEDKDKTIACKLKDEWIAKKLIKEVYITCDRENMRYPEDKVDAEKKECNYTEHEKFNEIELENGEQLSMDERLRLIQTLGTRTSTDDPDNCVSKTLKTRKTVKKMEDIFKSFCAFGAGGGGGSGTPQKAMMGTARFAKFSRDMKLLDKNLTSTEVDIIFSKVKKNYEKMISYEQFKSALNLMADKKYPDDPEGLKKLEKIITDGCGPKTSNTTRPVGKDIVDRLTDSSKYTGSHKNRFDETGKGKGLSGRRDDNPRAKEGYVSGYKDMDTYDTRK